jgi:hypothetical protein
MRLGTYTTIDCPTGGEEVEEKALEFLQEQFNKIGGRVFKVINDHDFIPYPSFEVDYPEELLDHSCEDSEVCDVVEDCPLNIWHDKANEIEGRYSRMFD